MGSQAHNITGLLYVIQLQNEDNFFLKKIDLSYHFYALLLLRI